MASMFKSGSSRRKADAPGKIRIQFQGSVTKVSDDDDDDDDVVIERVDDVDEEDDEADDQLHISFGNGIPDDLPEGTVVVQPEAVEDSPVRKKRDAPVRIDTKVLDNVSCTACGRQLNPYRSGAVQKHHELKVVICKHCEKFLSSGEISKDEDGADEQCRWCGEGGRLLVCDDCSGAFCKACVMRNFSRSEFNNINSQDSWQCYLCNTAPLQGLKENYRKIHDTLKALHQKKKAKAAAVASSPAGSGQSSKRPPSNAATKGGKTSQGASAQNNLSGSTGTEPLASSTLLNIEELNVLKLENVDATIDRLFTATSTFKEVLQALRSQYSSVDTVNIQQKRQQHSRALKNSLKQYMQSLQTILIESPSTEDSETQLVVTQDKCAEKSDVTKSTSSSDKSEAKKSTYSSSMSNTCLSSRSAMFPGTVPRGSGARLGTNGNCIYSKKPVVVQRTSSLSNAAADSECEIIEIEDDLPKDDTKKDARCFKNINGGLTKKVDSASTNSDSSKKTSKGSETDRSARESSKDKCRISVTSNADITKTAKDNIKNPTTDSDKSPKDRARESVSDGNVTDVNNQDKINDSERSNKSGSKRKKIDSEDEASSNQPCKDKTSSELEDNQKVDKKVSRKTDSDSILEKLHKSDEAEQVNVLNSNGDASRKKSVDQSEKENEVTSASKTSSSVDQSEKENEVTSASKTSSSVDQSEKENEVTSASKTSSSYDDENLAAKFDLIKELADEMLKKGKDSDEENGENDDDDALPITFGVEVKSGSETDVKTVPPKRKKSQVSSDEDTAISEKRSKASGSSDAKEASDKGSKKANMDKKQKQDSEDVGAANDDSTSDLSASDGDDADVATRRQKRKSRGNRKPAEKNLKTTKTKEKAEKKSEKKAEKSKNLSTKPQSSEMDDIDKEIAKLSKLPVLRKRKAADMSEDEAEDKEPAGDKADQKAQKKAKPGPKSSKKGINYDDLSSDENEKKGDEDDDDIDEDEDELPVTFFENNADAEGQKDLNLDENEIAKNGLLEDIATENDDSDAEDESSSDEDSDDVKKSPKKVKKEPKQSDDTKKENDTDAEKNADSDEDVGKRTKIRNKLLDAKLSDSDSDIGKPKKKKEDDDDESFKSEKSSNSSTESSDLSDDDDDSNGSEDEDEEDGAKSKKKGKKKKNKKGKSKKKSEDEDEGSDEGGKKNKKSKGKKRRRIKKMSSSSNDGDGDDESKGKEEDDDDPDSSKAGTRKQIRKVMSSKRLEDSTRAAAKAEEKRRKRISAKQREFNIETITDDNNPMNCPVTTKLVLEAGKEEGDKPLIEVNKKLIRKLKPHQVEAVQFLWDCLYESVKRSKKEEGAGCILAHCMGLGKTLSVVAFVHTVLTHDKYLKHKTCLIVSPLNTVLNWKNEWSMWLDEKDQLEVWELASCKQNGARADALKDWQESGGIMILGYEMYRNLTIGNRCKSKKLKKIFQETLVDPGPDLVVCDEGHILKNEASAISKAMNQMKTKRRVVLTGTPLQNNLTEYHCMVSFVKPNLLGTRKEFTNRFINPIQNGQCTDSTPRDFKVMKARAHVLHEMLAGCVQRRDYSALTKFLPPKQEYVISVRLTNIQIELYEKYLELTGQGVDGVFTNKGARLFTDYQNLMKIWTHPWVLKLAEIRDELKAKYDDEDEDSFIDDESDAESSFSTSSSSSSSSEDDKHFSDSGGEGTSAKKSTQKGTRRTRAKARRQAGEDSDPEEVILEWKTKRTNKDGDSIKEQTEEVDKSITKDWWAPYVSEDDQLKLELSNKLFLLFEILRMCEEIGDKVLIFSQSILSLNIIESFLEMVDSKFQQECENMTEEEREKQGVFGRSWTKNLDYFRMDGSTSVQNRQMWASSFNDIDNYRTRLFLISTRAGGLGINLVAANRVIIFDASWNPSHDVQSIFRVYRFGQIKPCYIYRFLAQGTMEEKIYERQVTKLSLSQRVVDEHQIERHFSANDLKELYNFRPDRWDDGTEKPTLSLPKDPLLAEILTANKHCVVSFHEHDSLLENQIEQTLTEEEKKTAWEEYENEKKGINIKGPGNSSWPMMAAAQILSREQITATVQALRQQLPDISEDLFQLHLQQALKRQVQIKQDMRRMELLRLQEMNYLNMIKQQTQQGGLTSQVMQNMAPWLQMQQLKAGQSNQMLMGGSNLGMHPTSSMSWQGQNSNNPISNNLEDAIDLDDN